MDQSFRRDTSQEKTTKSTEKPRGLSFSKKLILEKYTYKEQRDDERLPHGDPNLDITLQSHSQHLESTSDSDPEDLHPAVGLGTTPDLQAHDPSASDQGTLAGGVFLSRIKRSVTQAVTEGYRNVERQYLQAQRRNRQARHTNRQLQNLQRRRR
jgi:hypothetical protein